MEPLNLHKGIVIPLDRANVDTDAIIPKQFLKSIKKSGFGPNLFDEWRYLDHGEPGLDNSKRKINKDFVLNLARYKNGSILIARENFGCGSSREHAPWALLDFGIRVVIASSFADIFYGNCFKNGILPITLEKTIMDQVFTKVQNKVGYEITVNLEKQKIYDDSEIAHFEIDSFKKSCLMDGLDDIGLTLKNKIDIQNFEKKYQEIFPWLKGG
ncbi:3-isopropylmalate dehydratase small subunit [Methylophilaceae bacterium]|jgi:3-isopropylmalate/(R)-2-methylmalate dehydratase small subunit|nr:3-isopropylmalate dehydratase small subunit [Methylophilaceae bacterium]|tara:strand:+ start:1896 stop:2534 length:639 start_codon:yes stop_codon:yes gene_type:complete